MKLIALEGLLAGREFPIDTRGLVLGRSADCDVVIDDDDVSREHSRVLLEADAVILHDLGSRNGTIVNGVRIDRPTQLSAGDLVVIGGALFEVQLSPSDRQPARAAARPHAAPIEAPSAALVPPAAQGAGRIAELARAAAESGRRVAERLEHLRIVVPLNTADLRSAVRAADAAGGEPEALRLVGVCLQAQAEPDTARRSDLLSAEAAALAQTVAAASRLLKALSTR
jgi:predicted component of type VI protein secretion system